MYLVIVVHFVSEEEANKIFCIKNKEISYVASSHLNADLSGLYKSGNAHVSNGTDRALPSFQNSIAYESVCLQVNNLDLLERGRKCRQIKVCLQFSNLFLGVQNFANKAHCNFLFLFA